MTNNFGMIGSDDATIEKPPDEYRIAILGDSFCATTPSDVTWPALLQKIANQDEPLKHQVGKSVIKVLNFALDGTAAVQYPDSYKYKAAKFNPDLVIVNFVSSHISPLYALSRHPSGWRRRLSNVQLLDASRRHREQEL